MTDSERSTEDREQDRAELAALVAHHAKLMAERDEARYTAAILAHAYDHDSRPPESALMRARVWQYGKQMETSE